MTTQHRKFDAAFRDESVRLVLTSGRPVKQVCQEIGVKESTLGNWVRKYRQEHPEASEQAGTRGPVPWEEHQKTLAENSRLKAEVDFLEKVSAFFAAKQP